MRSDLNQRREYASTRLGARKSEWTAATPPQTRAFCALVSIDCAMMAWLSSVALLLPNRHPLAILRMPLQMSPHLSGRYIRRETAEQRR